MRLDVVCFVYFCASFRFFWGGDREILSSFFNSFKKIRWFFLSFCFTLSVLSVVTFNLQLVNLGKSITDFTVESRDEAMKEDKEQDNDQEQLDEEMGESILSVMVFPLFLGHFRWEYVNHRYVLVVGAER